MAKKSPWMRVVIGVGLTIGAIGVIAAGTAIGNNGLKNQLDKWKEDIKDKLDDKKDDSTKTSTQAAIVEKVYFQE